MVALAHQPWASASDLARRLDMSDSDIHKACHEFEEKKLIAGRGLGATRRNQRRYVLTRESVRHVIKPFRHKGLVRPALPLTWQMTEGGVTRMLLWLPMIESLYEILPTFWTCGLATPFQWESRYADPSCSSHVWLGVPILTEVRWLPRGRLHVVATWRFERDSERPRSYSIPIFWAGLLPQQDFLSRSLRLGSDFIGCHRGPTDAINWDIDPPVTAIGLDEFASFRSKTGYGDDVQVGSVDTAGCLVWSAEASHSEWTLKEKFPQARSIGHPEAAAIGEGPDLVNLGGIREYRILDFVSQFRAATRANLVTAFHMSGGAVKTSVETLTDRGLITTVGKHIYVTQRGLAMLADRDRVNVDRLVEVTYPDPEGEDAVRERRHDAAVAAVAAAFQRAGIPVAAGWRWVVSWKDGQLVPDLWVQVSIPDGGAGIWVAVELEFSAKTVKRIKEEKLRSYRMAPVRLRKAFPILVITGEELAAKRFDDLAGDLCILTTTLKAFLTGVWEGPESVWRRKDCPVALNEIVTGYGHHLWQETGQVLDYSKPTPEVWARLLSRESFGAAPWADLLGQELPPIGPRLRVERDYLRNEAEAGSSTTKPGSVPVPQAPSPAPVGKTATAQDRVLHQAPTPPTPAPEPVRTLATVEDRVRRRAEALRKIHRLLAEADRIAGWRLQTLFLTDSERLCLRRVRAIITYGVAQHHGVDERRLEQIAQLCLELEDQHQQEVRSGNPLWWITMSETKINPRKAFRNLLTGYPKTGRDACKTFDQWTGMVDRAVRAVRRAGTFD